MQELSGWHSGMYLSISGKESFEKDSLSGHAGCPCPLLYSGSLRLWVLSFLLISCFLDLTMAELLSVSLLKKAGGWPVFPGDLEPTLQGTEA